MSKKMDQNKKTKDALKNSEDKIQKIIRANFFRSLRFKLTLIIILTLLFNAPIAKYLNFLLAQTGITNSSIGPYIKSVIDIFVVTFIVLIFFHYLIIKPLLKNLAMTNLISQGDLSQRIEYRGKDEFAQLGEATNKMLEKLCSLMINIKNVSGQVDSASNNLEQITNEFAESIEEVAAAMEEVSAGSTEQTNIVNQAVKKLEELNSIIKATSNRAENAKKISNETTEIASKGEATVMETKEKMQAINQTVTEIDTIIKDLDSYSSKIGQIVEVIGDISEQPKW